MAVVVADLRQQHPVLSLARVPGPLPGCLGHRGPPEVHVGSVQAIGNWTRQGTPITQPLG